MSGTPPYVELHAHSAYSFGRGTSLPAELVEHAAGLGYEAIALTDHDSVSGSMEFAMAATANRSVRAIHGAEVTLDDGRHLTLLVRDIDGWRNLCRLLTLSHEHTRDTQDRRAGQPSITLPQLLDHAGGLVCLTGCAGRGVHDEPTVRRLLDAFTPERLRVELQRTYAQGDRARNRMLERLAQRVGVAAIATGGVHAHTPKRALLQDALLAARNGLTLDASEPIRRPNHAHVLARPQAMAARLRDHPQAVTETVRLAETLQFSLCGDLGYRYPGSDSHDATRELAQVCHTEFAGRYPAAGANTGKAAARLEQELAIIDRLGLAGFFLLHHEILLLAREVALQVRGSADSPRGVLPPGRGRGSSVSSIVCFLAGLSHIDPIANELAIGRFLHEDLTALPDIDIDFPRDIRERLIPAIHERYGRDRTALVAAFATYRPRGAIRDLGKALGLPPAEIERVARGSEGWGGDGTVARDIATALGPGRLTRRWEWLARLADEAYGLPRHLSQHPGGMVLATRPLIDCCPVVPSAMQGRQMAMWDKDSCADAGFLKIDLLGLGMLSAVERCVQSIAERRGEQIDLSRIPFDDPQVFHTIQNADTTGVFQIESRAQMGSLRRTRPANLQDLTVQVALVRPGPIHGGAVNPYIRRRQRLMADPDYEVPYPHPSLREPLAETLGTVIFQDQVLSVAKAFAGFSAGQAESLRRAMSRKRSAEAMQGHREQFIAGARATHPDCPEQVIEQVWNMIAGFAGFGFPKAHSAAFATLAYQSTWLRVHYPAEFLCALLDEQPMGFYPPASLIAEAQHRGISTLPADVNASDAGCIVIADDQIRIGLSYVKGVRREDIDRIVNARHRQGAFTSLEAFASAAGAGTGTLERLAWSGACDGLAGGGPYARRTALWQLGITAPAVQANGGQQLALDLPLPDAPALPALDPWSTMIADYQATGISIDKHPLALLRPALQDAGARTFAQLHTIAHGDRISVGGLVIARQRPPAAHGITFLLLEDETGTLNVIVPGSMYEACRLLIRTEPLLHITGRLERHANGGGAVNLYAETINRLPRTAGTGQQGSVRELRKRAPSTGDDFSVVAPPALSFGRGRRR